RVDFAEIRLEVEHAPVGVAHVLDERQLEVQARLALEANERAELKDDGLVRLFDGEDRGEGDKAERDGADAGSDMLLRHYCWRPGCGSPVCGRVGAVRRLSSGR